MSSSEKNEIKTAAQWERYVASLEHFDAFAVDSSARIEQLDRLSDVIFSRTTRLGILEASGKTEVVRNLIESEDGLNKFLGKPSKSQVIM